MATGSTRSWPPPATTCASPSTSSGFFLPGFWQPSWRLWATVEVALESKTVKPSSLERLDTQDAREVLRAGTWDASDFGGYDRYWEWREDSIVCLRLFDEDAETCADSGPWTLENGRVCFRMQWWGLADQATSGCYRIVRTNGDGY